MRGARGTVDERQEHVRAVITAPCAVTPLRQPEQILVGVRRAMILGAATRRVVRLDWYARRTIERTEGERAVRLRGNGAHLVDRIDLRRQATARVGDELVVRPAMRERDRLRGERK